jgi:hypothetical protein
MTLGREGMFKTSQASDVGSIPIARSINHDDSIVLTPLIPLKRPIKLGFLVPSLDRVFDASLAPETCLEFPIL